MTFNGKYQTINYKGGIIVKKREYPNGFFIVFVVKSNTFSCNRESSAIPDFIDRRHPSQKYFSTLTFSIKPGISYEDYMIASFTTLAVILIFYIVFSFSTWAFYRWSNLRKLSYPDSIPLKNRNQSEVPETSIQNADVDDVDTRLDTTNLMLSDLAKKDEEYFEKKSLTYFWHVISIAIFYGILVVQLVITYQRVVNISGNQDICYYNFLCANPLSGMSDFNHIYSNIGYVLMGILFLIITFYRHRYIVHKDGCGIPKHYGLFYAMGVALIMEGVLSACYHICHNQSNFQFDTSFMYVMAALGIVQLYQKRHPDINATAYATFLVLGLAIFAAMIGILNGHILLWILFIISYVCLCIYITLNIYFLSYVRRGIQTVYNEWSTERNIRKAIEPKRKAHFTVLVIANVINIGLANMGILCYFQGTDFATFLLGLLMGNVVLYAIIYIIMKVIHHEKICIQPALYGILSLITWIGATYFFVNNTSMWTETAAESKQWNQHCALMEFYDYHDIWHLLSAPALFLSFMMLLTLDDDLINTPHKNIVVF